MDQIEHQTSLDDVPKLPKTSDDDFWLGSINQIIKDITGTEHYGTTPGIIPGLKETSVQVHKTLQNAKERVETLVHGLSISSVYGTVRTFCKEAQLTVPLFDKLSDIVQSAGLFWTSNEILHSFELMLHIAIVDE